jgi:hypothetical protein
MKIFIITVLTLLIVSLAGLEMVMSSLPDEPITPAEVRGYDPESRGYALPADPTPPVVCDTGELFAPAGHDEGVPGS